MDPFRQGESQISCEKNEAGAGPASLLSPPSIKVGVKRKQFIFFHSLVMVSILLADRPIF
jgi:hypothetical protein